ncbi:MAG: protein kinase [Polyangia bacterium]
MEGAGQSFKMACPACNARYDGGQFCAKDGTPLERDESAGREDLVGKVLADRYRVVRLLGEGGMGQVFEAQHVNINKRFAIKLLRPEIVSNPEAVARFRQEAWSASSIGHENIVEIDDFATLPNGSVYLAMELLAGISLAERMKEPPPISVGDALDLFSQVARGLQAAHQKAIIHRDMKPENVFLAEKHGRTVVKILDFGIAKVSGAEGAQSLTRTGAIFGTPHYMSPEQALGKPLDSRTDIYSVGVIMYEVFTGRVPFEAESFMGILTKHITSEPRRPTEIAPERRIPQDVETIILRAMAKEAGDRFQTMAELGQALVTAMQTHAPELLSASGLMPISSRPMTPSQPIAVGGSAPAIPIAGSAAMRRASSQSIETAATLDGSATSPVAAHVGPVPQPTGFEIEGAAKKRSGSGLVLGLLALAALGGGGTVLYLRHHENPPAEAIVPAHPIAATPIPTAAAPVQVAPVKPKIHYDRVIVDSLPPGAKILIDGKPTGETPDEVKVVRGETVNVVLHKDGFVDEPVTIDPQNGRKLLVKLDRVHARVRESHHPSRPAAVIKPPAQHPQVRVRRPVDPYERLDDNPSHPAAKKGGGSDVLNPY